MCEVTIIDAICGKGKTSWAIEYMNRNDEDKFIYITPYIDEVNRVLFGCSYRSFETPATKNSKGTKLEDFNKLLSAGKNIVSTHALFSLVNDDTLKYLKENEYTLSSIDESNELNNYIKLNNKDSLFIYGTLKNEELPNKIQILTEKITNSLTEDVKDNNSPYEEQTLFTLIKKSLHFLKDYSKTEPNFIVSSDNFYKLSTREQFKVFPFSLSLENNKYKVIGYKDIVLSLGIMTLYAAIKDKKITEEIKAKINQREKEEVLKLIYSNLRGKYSEGLIDLIRKMCETDKGKKLSIDDLSTLFEE